MKETEPKYYQQPVDLVCQSLGVDPARGLNSQTVTARQEEYGLNRLQRAKQISPWKIFFNQFRDVLIIILLIAAAISLGLAVFGAEGSPKEGLLILGIVLAIAVVGFFNEYKAEKTVEALRKLVGRKARVIRGGKQREIDAEQLVPGDIVILSEGQKVPADLRLFDSQSLRVNEASLTGESMPVSKQEKVIESQAALGDQTNMAFSSTLVTSGSGRGVVVATAGSTQIGQIASMVEAAESDATPMQHKLDDLGKQLGAGIILISALVFAVMLGFDAAIQSESMVQRVVLAFTAAVALAVAAIPEGLAFVVRISLALGARRMADRQALVRKLSAVEALGSTDVICSDKTGTLTRGEMTVRQIYDGQRTVAVSGSGYQQEGDFTRQEESVDPAGLIRLLACGALCNDADLKQDTIIGDPTEAALLVSAAKAGLDYRQLGQKYPQVGSVPFSSERKRMSTVHKYKDEYAVFMKGSPEKVLEYCDQIEVNGQKQPLTEEVRQKILSKNDDLSAQALRVLGFAYKRCSQQPKTDEKIESELVFLGLQGMMDPPRTEIRSVMEEVTEVAQVRVAMITGDYIETAKAVAAEVGIEGQAISGSELDQLSDDDFRQKVEDIAIYARVDPKHKIRIVEALQAHGHQVAMTGDGVNDAPAIKAADIGIAMGITGTDVSKEAADLILLDDQFPTIIAAIEEGRGIFDNVRKFVTYLLSANIAEVFVIFFGLLQFKNLLLTPAQLLFINIVTDGLPAVALGSDPAESTVMQRKPENFQANIITRHMWSLMIIFGLILSVVLLWQYHYNLLHGGAVLATSVTFTGLVVLEMAWLWAIRSEYKIGWFSNPWLLVAMAASLSLVAAVLYIPALAGLFEVVAISSRNWLVLGGISIGIFSIMKIMQSLVRRVF